MVTDQTSPDQPAAPERDVEPRHARFLVDSEGKVVFLLAVNDDDVSFTAKVYTLGMSVAVSDVVETLTTTETYGYWEGYVSVEEYASCYFKWDGCRHLALADGSVMTHLCDRDDFTRHLALLEHLYNLAATHIAKSEAWADDVWYAREHEPLPERWAGELLLSDVRVPLPR